MSQIYCVRSDEFVQKILSEQKISIDMVDYNAIQGTEEFEKFSNPSIMYSPSDFLFTLSNSSEKLFNKQEHIDLSQVDRFGWYYGKIHKSGLQIYSSTSPQKYRRLFDQNPRLNISSYDKLRELYRPANVTNLLNGAFGLSYYCFRERYDDFFVKIKVDGDQWVINRNELNKEDYLILAHLFLYHNMSTKAFDDFVYNAEETRAVKVVSFFLSKSMEYLLDNDYSMDGYLKKMEEEFKKDDQIKRFAQEFSDLNDKYVKKGISFDPETPFAKAAKDFIDLAKTDTDDLHKLTDMEGLGHSAIFLLGMLNLADRMDEQLSLDHFIFAFVELTAKYIVDVKGSEKEIIICFDSDEINKNRNKKFDYISNYFKEIKDVRSIREQVNKLKSDTEAFEKIYSSRYKYIELEEDLKKLENEKNKLEDDFSALKENIQDSKWYTQELERFFNLNNKKESLEKENDKIKVENEKLEESYRNLENELNEKEENLSSIEEKLKKLDHEIQVKEKKLDPKEDDFEKQDGKVEKKPNESAKKELKKSSGKKTDAKSGTSKNPDIKITEKNGKKKKIIEQQKVKPEELTGKLFSEDE